MSKVELKPCGHCNGRARIATFKKRIGVACPHTVFRQHVVCTKCGAQTKVFKSPGKAERVWNTRFEASLAPDAVREALEALVTAVTFADPPKMFNEVLCHEARVPVEFVEAARIALSAPAPAVESSLSDGWQPLSQDYAENELKACLDAMLVARDDKCLIDEMRKRGLWVYQRPTATSGAHEGEGV